MCGTSKATGSLSESPSKKSKKGGDEDGCHLQLLRRSRPSSPSSVPPSTKRYKHEINLTNDSDDDSDDDDSDDDCSEILVYDGFVGESESGAEAKQESIAQPQQVSKQAQQQSQWSHLSSPQSQWSHLSSPPFEPIASALARLSSDKSRLTKRMILAHTFLDVMKFERSKTKNPLPVANLLHLVSNNITAIGSGCALGIGERTINNAIKASFLCKNEDTRGFGDKGDAAKAVFEGRSRATAGAGGQKQAKQQKLNFASARPKPVQTLTLDDIFECIRRMSAMASSESKVEKINKQREELISNILSRCQTGDEVCYFVRILIQNVRTGSTLITVGDALCEGSVLLKHGIDKVEREGKKKYSQKVWADISATQTQFRLAYNLHRNVTACVNSLLTNTPFPSLALHVPSTPMLAEPTSSVTGVHDYFRSKWNSCRFSAEFKYDGMRSQIHFEREPVKITVFSRDSADITKKHPSLTSFFKEHAPNTITDFIIDGEIVPVSLSGGNILPFQKLNATNSGELPSDVSLNFFAFDILKLNGESLLDAAYIQRRETLRASFEKAVFEGGIFKFAQCRDFECGEINGCKNEEDNGEDESKTNKSDGNDDGNDDVNDDSDSENGNGLHSYLLDAIASKTEGLMLKVSSFLVIIFFDLTTLSLFE